MKKIISKSIEETQNIAKGWLYNLVPNIDEATVVGLYGNLGSGKTAFTKCLAKELGVEEVITSPTFVIMKIYEIKNNNKENNKNNNKENKLSDRFKKLVHIDAYRLDSGKDLAMLDFESIVSNKNNLVIIEWPENVATVLPKDSLKIECEFIDEGSRGYSFI